MPKRPTFSIETITPELAAEYLQANRKNRPLSTRVAREYAAAIRRGEWMMNAEAIKFDTDGNLQDGQHRLQGVIFAEQAIETLVARGLDPEAFKTIDTGKLRNPGDILALRGIRHPMAIATAYRNLFRYLKGGKHKGRISNTQLLALVDRHPKLVSRGYECFLKPLDAKLIAGSSRVFFYYLASSIDATKARDFLAGVARPNVKQPNAKKLHDRLVQTMAEVIPPSAGVKWFWLIECWNAELAGRLVKKLSRLPDRRAEWKPRPKLTL